MPKRDPKGKRKIRTLLTDAEEKAKYQKRAGILHSDPNISASFEFVDPKDEWDARTGKLLRDPVFGPDQNHPEKYGNHIFDEPSGGMSIKPEDKVSRKTPDGSEAKKWYETPDQKDAVSKFSGVDKPAVKKTGVRPAVKTLLSADTDKTVLAAPAKAAVAAKKVYSGFGEEDRTAGRRVKGNEEYDSETNKKKKK